MKAVSAYRVPILAMILAYLLWRYRARIMGLMGRGE